MAEVETKVNVGVVIEVHTKVIPLIPKESAFRVTEVGLQPGMKVDFGAAEQCLDEIVGVFKPGWKWATEKTKLANLPPALQSGIDKLLKAHLSIEQLHLKLTDAIKKDEQIPDKANPGEMIKAGDNDARPAKNEFTLGMSLTWPDVKDRFGFANVTLAGIYLNVTNEGTALVSA